MLIKSCHSLERGEARQIFLNLSFLQLTNQKISFPRESRAATLFHTVTTPLSDANYFQFIIFFINFIFKIQMKTSKISVTHQKLHWQRLTFIAFSGAFL